LKVFWEQVFVTIMPDRLLSLKITRWCGFLTVTTTLHATAHLTPDYDNSSDGIASLFRASLFPILIPLKPTYGPYSLHNHFD